MTGQPADSKPTIVDVVRVLRETYTDYGVVLWLNASNKNFQWGWSPAAMLGMGRITEVMDAAERIEGGA